MKTSLTIIFFMLFMAVQHFGLAQASQTVVSDEDKAAYIEVTTEGEQIKARGIYTSDLKEINRLYYRFTTIKEGRSGSSKSSQGGSFIAIPSNKRILSNTTVNIGKRDKCAIMLQVFKGDKLIAQDSVTFGDF